MRTHHHSRPALPGLTTSAICRDWLCSSVAITTCDHQPQCPWRNMNGHLACIKTGGCCDESQLSGSPCQKILSTLGVVFASGTKPSISKFLGNTRGSLRRTVFSIEQTLIHTQPRQCYSTSCMRRVLGGFVQYAAPRRNLAGINRSLCPG